MAAVVAYLNAVSWIAGAERSMADLISGLDRTRYTPVAILPGPGPFGELLESKDVPVRYAPFYGLKARNPLRYFQTVLRIAGVMREFNAEILHVNHQYCANYGVLAARIARKKVLCHVRGIQSEQFVPWLNRADRVVLITDAVMRHMVKHGLKPSADHLVVYNGVVYDAVVLGEVGVPVEDVRRGQSVDSVVGYVGQLIPDKGVMELVRAARLVLQERPDTVFRLVGEDPRGGRDYADDIRAESVRLGVSDRVEMTGFQASVGQVMRGFDLLVVPSWEEAFGRVVVEGMLSGIPVIGTRAGGIPEVIEDGLNGLLVPPKDPEALAQAILRTLAMSGRDRRSMIEFGLERAQMFSVRAHADQIQSIYDELLNQNGNRTRALASRRGLTDATNAEVNDKCR